MQKELLNVANAKGNYDSIVDEIYRLREAEQTQDITEYNEQLVRRLIAKITVYDEKVIVEFKSGTSVDIHR